MAIRCITGARFTMNAEILNWTGQIAPTSEDVGQGTWETYQDPITLEILNRWEPIYNDDNPATPDNEATTVKTIQCLARGIVDGGIRVAGTTERFGDSYENIDFVKMWVPAHVNISKRSQVTNIRDKRNGKVVWVDEEHEDGTRATIFNVNGVTPLFDAFNKHIENFVLLEKAE